MGSPRISELGPWPNFLPWWSNGACGKRSEGIEVYDHFASWTDEGVPVLVFLRFYYKLPFRRIDNLV